MPEPRISPSCAFPVLAMAPGMLGQLLLLFSALSALLACEDIDGVVQAFIVLGLLISLGPLCALVWLFALDTARGKPPRVSWLSGPSAVHVVGVISMLAGLASAGTAVAIVILVQPIPFFVTVPALLGIAIPTAFIFVGVIGTFVHMRRRVRVTQVGAVA